MIFWISCHPCHFSALPSRAEVYESTTGVEAKQADFAVCSILLLASQHSLDDIRPILEFHKINNQTTEQITECYEKFKTEIAVKLAKQGNSHNIQHVTSVAVEIQTSSDELQYRINLQTFDPVTGQSKAIQEMFCNQEELQSLINKLKDVERHCERISK